MLCLIVVLCSAPAAAAATETPGYRVSFEGIADKGLLLALEAASDAVQLRTRSRVGTRSPVGPAALRMRAERDLARLAPVVKAHGYYAPRIDYEIDAEAAPVQLVFRIELGPPYTLSTVSIETPDGRAAGPADPQELGLTLGERAQAAAILAAQRKLLQWFGRRGHPFPAVADRKVIVDHAARTVSVHFVIEPGPTATFGELTIGGLKSVNERVVRNELPWKTGRPFNGDLLPRAQSRLTATGLFGVVQVTTGDALDENGRVPMHVQVTERRHRTASLGLSYRTDEGFGVKAAWQHRNLLGQAERLEFAAAASDITTSAAAEFSKPYFRRLNQTLILGARVAKDSPEPYTSRSAGASAVVRRQVSKPTAISAGLAYKYSTVEQIGEEEIFSLVSVPMTFDWDTSDDLLSPTRGGRLGLGLTPFYDLRSADLGFVKGRVQYARYVALSGKRPLVLAGRIAAGTIAGATSSAIPADERFYAGGGGSIRGYAYQTVSPLDGTDPIGGKSLFELSLELRIPLSSAIGIVPFVDAGNAYADSTPDVFADLLWAAGIGLRYSTPIGPIRLDVGFPLDRRDGIDDAFQIYLSLGQSF